MKKIIITLMLIVSMVACLGAFVGCTDADYTVGILQQLQHDALDLANQGFQEELTELLKKEGKTVTYLNQNASNDESNCTSIASTLNARNCDLILAIATTAAQAVKNATIDSKIPSLFTAVTEPISAGLLMKDSNGGCNMTGTSDLNPVEDQIKLLKEIIEGNGKTANRLGGIYMTSEPNSVIQIDLMEAACKKLGIGFEKVGLSSPNEITVGMERLSANCDGIYIPTDNTLANAADSIHLINLEGKKLPIVCGETSMNVKCGIATYGVEYLELGKATARMAFDILVNGKNPVDMPVQYQTENLPLTISQSVADALGITIPQSVLDRVA